MSKKKIKIFNVYCEVYGTNLLVIIGIEPSKIRPYLEKKYKIKWDYEENFGAGGQLDFPVWPYHVIFLKDKLPKEDLIPKLAHEIFHQVLRVCKTKQIPTYPEIDNLIMDEPAAYLMEFYMREIIKKL